MTDRLTDEQVAWYAGTSRTARWTADMSTHENIVTLAREVQEDRALRPICPTCDGRAKVNARPRNQMVTTTPCPDCTDGRAQLSTNPKDKP